MKETNQILPVIGIVVLFLAVGFTYKYTFSPEADAKRSIGTGAADASMNNMPGMSMVPQVAEIGADPANIPPPITRKENTTVKIALSAVAVRSELAPGVTYEYWTYNKQVPGPFLRVKEGDTVEISLHHDPAGHMHSAATAEGLEISGPLGVKTAYADGMHAPADTSDPHMSTAMPSMGHETHSVDLHSVLGPGGGAMMMQAVHGETKTFSFKAMRPGIYIYHCASPHIPTHITNGMYGMILVEPKAGMPKVDHEYYVMQGEFYTTGKHGEQGLQGFSLDKLDAEHPEYVVFNGRVGSLTGARALTSKVGETVRIFFGVGTFLPSNFL